MQRLMIALALPPALLNAITDWVDADDIVTEPGGAEDAWYSSQARPGLAANGPVRRVSELLAVRGANAAAIARLLPFVSALDAPITVNVNTAPPEVLSAVVGGLDATGAAALIASRTAAPFATVAEFRSRLPRPDLVVDETQIGVGSVWFEVSIEARQGDTLARARALLQRTPGVRSWPVVVWQVVE
jgi:general secretion pathway protein K